MSRLVGFGIRNSNLDTRDSEITRGGFTHFAEPRLLLCCNQGCLVSAGSAIARGAGSRSGGVCLAFATSRRASDSRVFIEIELGETSRG